MAGRAAFEGRRLPVGWTGSEREQEHFPWFTPRRTAAHPRGGRRGESITGRRAAQPQGPAGKLLAEATSWRPQPRNLDASLLLARRSIARQGQGLQRTDRRI